MSQDQIVISGISGRFPESANVDELWDNLMKGVDMVTEDGRRWKPGLLELPKRNGKLKEIDKFDADFFEIHPKQANNMDPMLRILLEVSYEAMLDAGINPDKLRGSRTGVWVGVSGSETAETLASDVQNMEGYVMTGCSLSMFANRVSFFNDFKGPSIAIDTACSSSLLALHLACESIKRGECDAAIVAGAHLVLRPHTSLQFKKLKMLSPDGACKAFDESANGYVRSEAVAAVFICKSKSARRSYCEVVHSKTGSDGHKKDGITFPSGTQQANLLQETYDECGVDPSKVVYVEAHGTGTKVGDPQELGALDHVMCGNRTTPLLVGSIKSNVGHCEPASGICGVIKCVMAMKLGILPANLHIKKLNSKIETLMKGRIKPVTAPTPLPNDPVIGVNSFGFGGTNVHVILRANQNSAVETSYADEPTICLLTARTEEGIKQKINQVRMTTPTVAAFINGMSDISIDRHPYRGFVIHPTDVPDAFSDDVNNAFEFYNEVKTRPPVWFVCPGMGSQWIGMGKDLLKLPVFSNAIDSCTEALQQYGGLDVKKLLQGADENTFKDNITFAFVGIASIQIGLIDLLTSLGVTAEGFVGHSVGELACSYADRCLTRHQTIQAAYVRGECVKAQTLPEGAMAAVGLGWDEFLLRCPANVQVACHNATDNVTITGPRDDVTDVVATLREEGVYVRMVDTGGIAFHSSHMEQVYPSFLEKLKVIIPEAKPRSKKWISTSAPRKCFDMAHVLECSAEYHANNLRSPVYFCDAIKQIPSDAVTVDISPHCILQPILKRTLHPTNERIVLTNRNETNGIETLMSGIGKLHCLGINVNANNIYGRDTFHDLPRDFTSGHVSWDHSKMWHVPSPSQFFSSSVSGLQTDAVFKIDTSELSEDRYLRGHVIDGRPLLPATALLRLAWQTFANFLETSVDIVAVQFDDVTIHGATLLTDTDVDIFVQFVPHLHDFTISVDGRLVASGKIRKLDNYKLNGAKSAQDREKRMLDKKEIYKKLKLCGYQYDNEFQVIHSADQSGTYGKVKWNGNYVTFMDSLLQFILIRDHGHSLRLPTRIRRLKIVPFEDNNEKLIDVERSFDRISAGENLEINEVHVTNAPARGHHPQTQIKVKKFIPNNCEVEDRDVAKICNVAKTFLKENKCLLKNVTNEGFVAQNMHEGSKTVVESLTSSTLLKLLQGVFNTEDPVTFLRSLNCLHKEGVFMSTLDIAIENLNYNIKFGEILNSSNESPTTMVKSISKHAATLLNCEFTHYIITKTPTMLDATNVIWNAENEAEIPSTIRELNVVFCNNLFHRGISKAAKVLKNLREHIALESWFFILHQTFQDNPIRNILQQISSNSAASTVNVTLQQVKKLFRDENFELISHKRQSETGSNLMLFRHKAKDVGKNISFEIKENNFEWVPQLKECMSSYAGDIWLIARHNLNGVAEFTNALRREMKTDRIRCIANLNLDPKSHFPVQFDEVMKHQLAVNVYQDGKWGTLQHTKADESNKITSESTYLRIASPGDLTTLQWTTSPQSITNPSRYDVKYSGINFRDVMLATGKLPPKAIPGSTWKFKTLLGLEFSGVNNRGERRAGIVPAEGFSTHVTQDEIYTWRIPPTWTFEEASTVPVVYSTAYYALVVRGNIQPGESILIHSGSGGVGQASISVALSRGCRVFTTVSTEEKKRFLMERFPALTDDCFANSRQDSFEKTIMTQTNGKGVDLLLNSLSGDLLQASLRCLAENGRFLEIGKFDMFHNSNISMAVFLKNVAFHGILLDALFHEASATWLKVWKLVQDGIENGEVRPLPYQVFQSNKVEEAFRFMAQGKHIGKVLVNVSGAKPATPRVQFDPTLDYVITGGLGGFGIELCDWMIQRGALKISLTSRSGKTTAYHESYISYWKQFGAVVKVCKLDVSKPEQVEPFLNDNIGGIFHLAVELRDAMFQNQTKENFQLLYETKCCGILNLDRISRKHCPKLQHFVAFSSAASINGTKGQTNYILANSIMEQVCRVRHREGLPATAIQWGAVGDVGVAMETQGDVIIAGSIPQRMKSCLQKLEFMLSQRTHAVVASYINVVKEQAGVAVQKKKSLQRLVADIIGIQDEKKVSRSATLLRLGADSLMTTEIAQLLNKDYGVNVSTSDVGQLTFYKLDSYKSGNKPPPPLRKLQRLRSSSSSQH